MDQLEDQRDRLIPSEIAGDRVMGKSEGRPWLCYKYVSCRNTATTLHCKKLMAGHTA